VKVLVLAAPGVQREQLVADFRRLGIPTPVCVDDWAALMQAVVAERPSVAFASLRSLLAHGREALTTTDWTFRALSIPVVLMVDSELHGAKYEVEASTELEHYISEPPLVNEITQVLLTTTGQLFRLPGVTLQQPASTLAEDPMAQVARAEVSWTDQLAADLDQELEDNGVGDFMDFPITGSTPTVDPSPMPPVAQAVVSPDSMRATAPHPSVEAWLQQTRGESPSGLQSPVAPAADPFQSSISGLNREVPPSRPRQEIYREPEPLPSSIDRVIPVRPAEPRPQAWQAEVPADQRVTASVPGVVDTPAADSRLPGASRTGPMPAISGHTPAPAERLAAYRTGGQSRPVDRATSTGNTAYRTGPTMPGIPREEAPPTPQPEPRNYAEPNDRGESYDLSTPGRAAGPPFSRTPIPMSQQAIRQTATSTSVAEDTAASASSPGIPTNRIVQVTLTGIRAGLISGIRVPKVLFGLSTSRATGRLRIVQDTLQREVLLLDGVFGRTSDDPGLADESRLLSTFAWESGSYLFEDAPIPRDGFVPFGEPLEVIFRGVATRLSLDLLMRPLTPFLRKYPVMTTAIQALQQTRGLERVVQTVRLLTGSGQTMERSIMATGESPEDVFRRAYFAWLTGSLVFDEAPAAGAVEVNFTSDFHSSDPEQMASVRKFADTMSRRRRSTGSSVVAAAVTGLTPAPGPSPSSSQDLASDAAARELNGMIRSFSSSTAYVALGLQPGCGLTAITSRYYELVRLYHPDRYARGYNEEVRALAQRVFLEIRSAYERAHHEEEHGPRPTSGVRPTVPPANDPNVSGMGQAGAQRAPTPTFNSSSSPPPQRKVSDVLERVRARHAASGATTTSPPIPSPVQGGGFRPGPSASSPPVSNATQGGGTAPAAAGPNDFASAAGTARVATLTSRPQAPAPAPAAAGPVISGEQLFRNAKRALVAGANAKALELLDQARERGISGPITDAHEHYLRYSLQELSAARVLPLLEEIAKSIGQGVELSQVYVLIGHILRLEEKNERALDFYTKALEADKLNEEATRWARYLRSRPDQKADAGQGFLNKILNAKISLAPSKKN
jgi:hypothetical protein